MFSFILYTTVYYKINANYKKEVGIQRKEVQ